MRFKNSHKRPSDGPNQENVENIPLLKFNFSPRNTLIISIGPYGGPIKDLVKVKMGHKKLRMAQIKKM